MAPSYLIVSTLPWLLDHLWGQVAFRTTSLRHIVLLMVFNILSGHKTQLFAGNLAKYLYNFYLANWKAHGFSSFLSDRFWCSENGSLIQWPYLCTDLYRKYMLLEDGLQILYSYSLYSYRYTVKYGVKERRFWLDLPTEDPKYRKECYITVPHAQNISMGSRANLESNIAKIWYQYSLKNSITHEEIVISHSFWLKANIIYENHQDQHL